MGPIWQAQLGESLVMLIGPSWQPNLLPYWAPNLGPIRETRSLPYRLPNFCSAIRATLGQRQIRQSPGLALSAHSGNEWGKIPVLTGNLSKFESRIRNVIGGPLVFEIWRQPGGPLVTSLVTSIVKSRPIFYLSYLVTHKRFNFNFKK